MKIFKAYISIFTLLALFAIMAPTAAAIGAAPLRAQFKAAPGETAYGYIAVQNTSDQPVDAVLTKGDFRIREDESIQFLMEASAENELSMQDWISFESETEPLNAGERKEMKYTITVPQDAKSQSYYGVVFVGGKTSEEGEEGGVGVSTNIAHLILMEVTGDLHSNIELQSFGMMKNETSEEGGKEIRFETKLFNSGNTHTAPEGRMIITDSSRQIIDEFPLNKDLFNDLPNRQKTLVNRWNYSDHNPGKYFAYIDGKTKEGQAYSAEMAFEINRDGEPVMLGTQLHKSYEDAIGQPQRNLVLPLAILIVLLFAAIVTLIATKCCGKKKSHKRKKKFLGLFVMLMLCGMTIVPSVSAQDSNDISINMTVAEPQVEAISLVGCWADSGGDSWGYTAASATLRQPSDREAGAGGDPYSFYDTVGGNPYGNIAPVTNNAFGYDDCEFQVTASGWSAYDITLYGTDFLSGGNQILDMTGYGTAGFDFDLENEDPDPTGSPNDEYPAADQEHGFFILNTSTATLDPAQDDGTAGGTSYSTPKNYDDADCGADSDRPCYHFVPSNLSPHTVFDVSAGTYITDETFDIRFGAGDDFSAVAGTYGMTVTLTLNTTP